jgi:hypothetical protein
MGSLLEVVQEWLARGSDELAPLVRNYLQIGAVAYDHATQRVIVPMSMSIRERQVSGQLAFSLLNGISGKEIEAQLQTSFGDIRSQLLSEIGNLGKDIASTASDELRSGACQQLQNLLGGTVNSDCQLVVGTIAIDGVRVLEPGRIDHSMLRIFRTDDAQSPRFDPDAVRELVLSLTRLPRDVILIPRDPVRTVEGIKMPVSVQLDMFGTSFDVGEVCIGLDGRCRQQLTNLREVRIDLVEKSGELRGSHRWNVRSQSHYLTAPFPIGLSKGSQQRAHTGSGTAPVV